MQLCIVEKKLRHTITIKLADKNLGIVLMNTDDSPTMYVTSIR